MKNIGYTNVIFRLCDWIMKLAYINLLWILFSLVGLIILGFFPATFAMFSVIRLLLMSDPEEKENISIFLSFLKYYKEDFWRSNGLGWGFSIILSFITFEVWLINGAENNGLEILYYPLLVIGFLFLAFGLYLVPTYVHFDNKFSQLLKNSFLIMLLNPFHTVVIVSGLFLISVLLMLFPAAFLFFSGSLPAILIMVVALRSYKKISEKKEIFNSNVGS